MRALAVLARGLFVVLLAALFLAATPVTAEADCGATPSVKYVYIPTGLSFLSQTAADTYWHSADVIFEPAGNYYWQDRYSVGRDSPTWYYQYNKVANPGSAWLTVSTCG